jgi:septal ring factor EnvC (AmiA/AmiB activator)
MNPSAGRRERTRRCNRTPGVSQCISQPASATMVRMLEELDALDGKMRELAAHVRQLREENQQLRRQLADSQSELATLNDRVAAATRRLDTLIEELPGEMRGNGR